MTVYGYMIEGVAGDDKGSLDEQRKALLNYSDELGVQVDDYFIEHDDGRIRMKPFAEREAAKRMIDTSTDGDILLIPSSEWVFVSARSCLELIDNLAYRSVSLYCCDLKENITMPVSRNLVISEGNATLIRKIVSLLSIGERKSHAETIRTAKKQMKIEGKYLGGPVPFGWRVKGKYLVKDREQQKIIREIIKLKNDRWSYRDISLLLREKFSVTLSHEGVRKIYRKEQEAAED